MKYKILKINIFIILTLFILCSCGIKSTNKTADSQSNSPQNVVEKFFQYKNEKDKSKLLTTLTEHWNDQNVIWDFGSFDSIKITNIEELKNKLVNEGYLKHGRGAVNGTTETNLAVFNVEYETKYRKYFIGPEASNKCSWQFFVIRKDVNSPWLIDDFGD